MASVSHNDTVRSTTNGAIKFTQAVSCWRASMWRSHRKVVTSVTFLWEPLQNNVLDIKKWIAVSMNSVFWISVLFRMTNDSRWTILLKTVLLDLFWVNQCALWSSPPIRWWIFYIENESYIRALGKISSTLLRNATGFALWVCGVT